MSTKIYIGATPCDPYIYQGSDGICAIRSEGYILACYGHEMPIDSLVQQATDNGWYEPEFGTDLENMDKLLLRNGVPCHTYSGMSIYQMKDALDQGRMIIAAVDANEVWNPGSMSEQIKDFTGNKTPNHALVVKDIDLNDGTVTLVDSAPGNANEVITKKVFCDAFDDSHNFCVITDKPAPYTYDGNGILVPSQASIDTFIHDHTYQMSDNNMIMAATDTHHDADYYHDSDDDSDDDDSDDDGDNDSYYYNV